MNEKAQQHLMTAARLLFTDPQTQGATGITAVFHIEPGVHGCFAYRFDDDGHAFFFPVDEFSDHMVELNSASQVPGDKPWVACLVQVKANGKLSCDFEYDNVDRWSVRPATYETDIARLRPDLQ
jgi:hypothetical protein